MEPHKSNTQKEFSSEYHEGKEEKKGFEEANQLSIANILVKSSQITQPYKQQDDPLKFEENQVSKKSNNLLTSQTAFSVLELVGADIDLEKLGVGNTHSEDKDLG